MLLHQILEPLGKRRLAAADRAQQVEYLALLLEALGGMLEIAHDALDGVFHAEETVEHRIGFDRAVEEHAAEARILGGVDQVGLADRRHHPLGGAGVEHLVVAGGQQPVPQAHRFESLAGIVAAEDVEYIKRAHRSRLLLRQHALPRLYVVTLRRRDKADATNARKYSLTP